MPKIFLTSTLLLLVSVNVKAEYRVFQYMVNAKYFLGSTPQAYVVTSTLDPVSYVSYHGGIDSIEANLVRTWTCPGNTAKSDYCPAPLDGQRDESNLIP